MDAFTTREKALEAKFQHEQMLEYKILSRRNRLFGLWAAEQLGLDRDKAEAYARGVVSGIFATPDGNSIVTKIMVDLTDQKIDISEHKLRKQLNYCHQDASLQIINE
jgi:hypothetical protein